MEYEKWSPTTYLFWAALMVIVFIPETPLAVHIVTITTFTLSFVWQLVQMFIIWRQRKAHLEAWSYKG